MQDKWLNTDLNVRLQRSLRKTVFVICARLIPCFYDPFIKINSSKTTSDRQSNTNNPSGNKNKIRNQSTFPVSCLARLTICLSLPFTFSFESLSVAVNLNYLMIYGFSALRVKNVSAIEIYLLSHQDFSAIILALNENYSSVQLSNEVLNTQLLLVKLKCPCAQMNKINKIPSAFFTVRNCEFSHNKLLLLS